MEDRNYITSLSEWFAKVGVWSFDHRIIVSLAALLAFLGGIYLSQFAQVDNSLDTFFDRQDPVYVDYLNYRRDFGSDEMTYILYHAPTKEHGPFDIEVMRSIEKLTRELELNVPFVKEVTSLSNVEFMQGNEDGSIDINNLLYDFPETQAALLDIRDKVLKKPALIGGLVNHDATYAALLVKMSRSSIDPMEKIRLDPEKGDGFNNLYPQVSWIKIKAILEKPEYSQHITFYPSGDVPINAVYNMLATTEATELAGYTVLIVGVLLFLFLQRRITSVVAPLVVVALSIALALGMIGAFGWKLDMMFSMLPTLLIAIGVADSVHILTAYYAAYQKLDDRRAAVYDAFYHVGPPCLLTSVTTAIGLLALSFSPIKTMAHMAIYSAFGIMIAFFLSMTVMVVIISFAKNRPLKGAVSENNDASIIETDDSLLGRFLSGVVSVDIHYKKTILLIFGFLLAFSIVGISKIEIDSNYLNEFGEEVEIRQITDRVNQVMGGMDHIVYLFDTGVAGGVKNPAVLKQIEQLQMAAEQRADIVKKTYSIVDIIKDINQSFHQGDPDYYRIPESSELIAQYLLLYEMSGGEEAAKYVSNDYSRTNLEVRLTLGPTSKVRALVDDLDNVIMNEIKISPPPGMTGMGALWLRLLEYITSSQIKGLSFAFVAIAIMMCLTFRSIKIGMISMVPNISPVLFTLGMMGWVGMTLDYAKLLIATVAIGIAVDDTIHMVTRYHMAFLRSRDYEQALYESMRHVGRALFITSVVLVCGFLTYLFSSMDGLKGFGILLAFTIITTLIADFLLMPVLIMIFKPFGKEGDNKELPNKLSALGNSAQPTEIKGNG